MGGSNGLSNAPQKYIHLMSVQLTSLEKKITWGCNWAGISRGNNQN